MTNYLRMIRRLGLCLPVLYFATFSWAAADKLAAGGGASPSASRWGRLHMPARASAEEGRGLLDDVHAVFQRVPRRSGETGIGALQGTVVDGVGRAVGGVRLQVTDASTGEALRPGRGGEEGFTTTAEGIFRIRDVPAGDYELAAAKEGFQMRKQGGIKVEPGKTTILSLTLVAVAPTEEAGAGGRIPRRAGEAGLRTETPGGREESIEERAAGHERLPRRDLPAERPAMVAGPAAVPLRLPETEPLGAAGPSRTRRLRTAPAVAMVMPDRWRIGFPDWDRGTGFEAPYQKGNWWDPYNQNFLKGDYPIFGQRAFMNFGATSDTLVEPRGLYVPSGISADDPVSEEFFGRGEQFFVNQNFVFSFSLFHGDTAFRPVDWQVRVTPVFNINYLVARENGVVNIDVRRGTTRTDSQIAFQELFGEVKLADVNPYYDFFSVRVGIQAFTSDFRGFVFADSQPGVRLFGSFDNNKYQWNLAAFNLLEKDTNSRLNTVFESRHQLVYVANIYRQDFITKGYTVQGSIHFSDDRAGRSDKGGLHFDTNGFLVRPAALGVFRPHNIKVGYLGFAGDGHIGRLNLTHAYYQALGRDDFNPVAGRGTHINARMAAAEASVDRDWVRLKASFLYASGDSDPLDGTARGFDAILDNPIFAGGNVSFFGRQEIRLVGTNVRLLERDSFLPSLRSSKEEGQASFVNPGIFLFHAGADVELTPKLRALFNVSYLRFDRTEPLELLLFQSPVRHSIGIDYSVGVLYRPPLTENFVITAGAAALTPMAGFRDIFTPKTLISAFTAVRLTF